MGSDSFGPFLREPAIYPIFHLRIMLFQKKLKKFLKKRRIFGSYVVYKK